MDYPSFEQLLEKAIDGRIVIALVPARSSVAAPTLAEAVRLAMEAEGER